MNLDKQYKKKLKRAEGLDELIDIYSDILFIKNKVKMLPLLSRLMYKRFESDIDKIVNNEVERLQVELVYERANCAYEQTLKYNKEDNKLYHYLKGFLK